MFSRKHIRWNLSILLAAGVLATWAILGLAGNASAAPPPGKGGKDRTPPAAVDDLTVVGDPTSSTIALEWTATGDDGTSGTAYRYDIRYLADVPITEQNWDTATQASNEPTPQPSGSPETYEVTGLSQQTTYYVALKVRDEANNWSGISNVPSATTAAAQPGEWVFEVIDSEGDVGFYSALAYDLSGGPAIAYLGPRIGYAAGTPVYLLKLARWDPDPSPGGTWTTEVVDQCLSRRVDLASDPNTDSWSIAYIGMSSKPARRQFRLAQGNGSSWDIQIIGNTDGHPSLAYSPDGRSRSVFGHLHAISDMALERAIWSWDDVAGEWSFDGYEIVDPDLEHHYPWASAAYDAQGNPAIAYSDSTVSGWDTLKFAQRDASGWIIETVETGGSSGAHVSLAYDPTTDYPSIAHWGPSGFRFSQWNGTEWVHETVDEDWGPSLVYDASGTAFISYAGPGLLKLTHWNGNEWEIEIVQDNTGGVRTSLALDASGNPSLSYYDPPADDLKFARKLPQP